jgi:hypothetical protein
MNRGDTPAVRGLTFGMASPFWNESSSARIGAFVLAMDCRNQFGFGRASPSFPIPPQKRSQICYIPARGYQRNFDLCQLYRNAGINTGVISDSTA